ncbi:MAG: redoxin [Desulfobulbus propionicus]|nr:MAG: redoxin [Desulfobulbus propionicus]
MMNRFKLLPLVLLLFFLPGLVSATQLGEKLATFKQQDMNDNTIDMNSIIGKKPVMLVFWASWCPNCKTEAAKVNQIVAQYKDRGMEFIGINIGYNDSIARARSFIKKNKMAYPSVFDKSNRITRKYMVHGVPTVIVADANGIVQFRNYGVPEITEAHFKQLMGN